MPFKPSTRPETRAKAHASASSSAAQQFYSDKQAVKYTTESNTGIQRDLTTYALEVLHVLVPLTRRRRGDAFLLLDLGAGSGLSTTAATSWLQTRGVNDAFAVAFDISASMLSLTSDAAHAQRASFYCGNAAQRFPLRAQTFDAAIGISMLQWLNDDGLKTCFTSLFSALKPDCGAVFQVYPTSADQVHAMEKIALSVGFSFAEVFVAFPHSTTAKKWFLAVTKKTPLCLLHPLHSLTERTMDLCPFGRRHERRCVWHLLSGDECIEDAQDQERIKSLRERVGREHVREAWHIWRKFFRSTQFQKDNTAAPVHAKAKRSLELWKSDELIGEAVQRRFLDDGHHEKVTYELLLEHMDDVVALLHSAYSAAVALEKSLPKPPSGAAWTG
ncbi:hypothetical protein PINS_up006206 [Pythium insidiosum]|nr:hypothetical protein PINS_up006206 [Pythium insidiosum]